MLSSSRGSIADATTPLIRLDEFKKEEERRDGQGKMIIHMLSAKNRRGDVVLEEVLSTETIWNDSEEVTYPEVNVPPPLNKRLKYP